MRKLIVALLTVIIVLSWTSITFAAEEVSTNYFTENFSTSSADDVPLATSTTEGYNGWVLEDDSYYATASAEGTTMTVTTDPKDSTNKVLKLTRTVQSTDTVNLRGIHALKDGTTLNNENSEMVRISMKFMYTQSHYCLYIEPFLAQMRSDLWQATGGTSTEYTTEQKAIMANSPNEWIDIEFVLNYKKNSISLYANDTLIGTQECTPPQVSDITFLQLRHRWQSVTTMYVDDIKVDSVNTIASYKADNVLYTTKDGLTFTSTATTDGLLKRAYISKADTATGNCTAAFVCYDAQKQMRALKVMTLETDDFVNNKALIEVDLVLPEDIDLAGGQTKVIFWESISSLNPLEAASVFDIAQEETPTLFLFSDSTAANYRTEHFPRAGIGMMLGDYFDGITVNNQSKSGAGTDTVLGQEGADYDHSEKWTNIKNLTKPGDYVILKLGGNDASDDIGIEKYVNNLDFIIDTLHSKGVNVIMSTMNLWYNFDDDGKLIADFDENGNFTGTTQFVGKNSGADYLQTQYNYMAAKKNANTTGFTSINMVKRIAEYLGEDATYYGDGLKCCMSDTKYNWDTVYASDPRAVGSDYNGGVIDGVHLTMYGAAVYAKFMAEEISKLDIPIADCVTNLDKVITYPYFEYQYAE